MKKASKGILIFGWIEILTLLATFITLVHIERYPLILIFFPFPVALLGISTIKLNPSARTFNLFLSPLIVLTYSLTFIIILESLLSIICPKVDITESFFYIVFAIALISHIIFFTRSSVAIQFKKGNNNS
jgi:hypothetical protein